MKKIYSLLLILITTLAIYAQDAGVFESYTVLNINGTGNTYYDTQASTSNPDFNGTNLGSFTSSESIVVSGGEVKTWKNNGGDVTGAKILYKVYSGSSSVPFSEITFNWIENIGSNGDQKWGTTSGTSNILSGLAPGNYTLEVYFIASTNVGEKYSNNGGANYKATFTVTSTLAVDGIKGINAKSIISEGKLYTAKKGNINIQVMDFSGRLVKTLNVKSTGNEIELNLPKKGNYILKISNGSQSEVLKFAY